MCIRDSYERVDEKLRQLGAQIQRVERDEPTQEMTPLRL
jgi:UDP-N-acetylglucosamine enolpyruvyl transferase